MILSTLRSQTGTQHRHVERALDLPRHLRSFADYRAMLGCFYGYYAPLEHCLAAYLPTLDFPFAPFGRTHLLVSDLGFCGFTRDDLAQLSKCEILPTMTHLHQAIGCAYVVEGSALGGQVILRLAQQRYGLDISACGSFFSSGGICVGHRWSEFCNALISYVDQNPQSQDSIVSAATETFITFEQWISKACEC